MPHSMSLNEYCDHRQQLGLSHSYAGVYQAVRRGKIDKGVVRRKGQYRIDPEVADQEWAAATSGGRLAGAHAQGADPEPGQLPTRAESEARKLAAQAELVELDLQQRQGELVPIAEVETLWFTLGRQIRDAMEAIPARILERVLAETGELDRQQQASIRLILEGEIKQALGQLSKSMRDATRAG